MPQISLAKALKLKNRLIGRMNEVTSDIQIYNSMLEEQAGKVDVNNALITRNELKSALLSLKYEIYKNTLPIQSVLYEMAEKKGEITMFKTLNVRDGIERHGYQNTSITYVAVLKKNDVDIIVKGLESEVDVMQDQVDEFNHRTKIEVSQSILDLGS